MKKIVLILAALSVIGFIGVLGGCSRDYEQQQTPNNQPPPPQQARVVNVEILNFSFRPATVDVPIGSTIHWVNRDHVKHSITHRGGSLFDSVMQEKGGTFSYTFHSPGTYEYFDRINSQQPSGVIRVY